MFQASYRTANQCLTGYCKPHVFDNSTSTSKLKSQIEIVRRNPENFVSVGTSMRNVSLEPQFKVTVVPTQTLGVLYAHYVCFTAGGTSYTATCQSQANERVTSGRPWDLGESITCSSCSTPRYGSWFQSYCTNAVVVHSLTRGDCLIMEYPVHN